MTPDDKKKICEKFHRYLSGHAPLSEAEAHFMQAIPEDAKNDPGLRLAWKNVWKVFCADQLYVVKDLAQDVPPVEELVDWLTDELRKMNA